MSGPRTGGTFAYLLRGWEEQMDDEDAAMSSWRFSLEDPHTGVRLGFASLAKLMAALERQMDQKEKK